MGDEKLEFRVYTFPSGCVYEGTFLGSKKHGQGHWRHPNGEVYEGQYSDNKQQGLGVYLFLEIGKKYFGEWRDGAMGGQGVYYFNEEETEFYCGQYVADRKHGIGLYTYASGVVKIQEWHGGDMRLERDPTVEEEVMSYSTLKRLRADVRAVAPKVCGAIPDHVEVHEHTFQSGVQYRGEFAGTKKHGLGLWVHPSGETYEGRFEDNKHCGWGVYTIPSTGKKYVGHWQDAKMHGWGVYFFNEAETEWYCGTYVNDKKHGTGAYQYLGGKLKEQMWNAGELTSEVDLDATGCEEYFQGVLRIISIVSVCATGYQSRFVKP